MNIGAINQNAADRNQIIQGIGGAAMAGYGQYQQNARDDARWNQYLDTIKPQQQAVSPGPVMQQQPAVTQPVRQSSRQSTGPVRSQDPNFYPNTDIFNYY